jgi:hypothetical protein
MEGRIAHARIDTNQEERFIVIDRITSVTADARTCIARRKMLRTGPTQLILQITLAKRTVKQSAPATITD